MVYPLLIFHQILNNEDYVMYEQKSSIYTLLSNFDTVNRWYLNNSQFYLQTRDTKYHLSIKGVWVNNRLGGKRFREWHSHLFSVFACWHEAECVAGLQGTASGSGCPDTLPSGCSLLLSHRDLRNP